jgi:hypothetical protein
MRLQKKSLSKVSLVDLLRRKRTTLSKFLSETGIVTYELLVNRCNSIGVLPPSEDQFMKVKGNPITHEFSSPTEGIIVLNPMIPSDSDPHLLVSEDSTDNSAGFANLELKHRDQDFDIFQEEIKKNKRKKRKEDKE